MAAVLLEGRPVATRIKETLRAEIDVLRARTGKAPVLAALQIGENASSAVYVKAQKKAADELGMGYDLRLCPAATTQTEAEAILASLNKDPAVTAIILQMPVPAAIDGRRLAGLIAPEKDAEGMHPCHLGRVLLGTHTVGPCTALAIIELLKETKTALYGKEAVVIGHSAIVGKPLALMLLTSFATTTVCHIATGERGTLADHVKRAEVLVVAVGKPGIIKGEWIRDGAIVVDVGINRSGDRIVGDVAFDAATCKAAFITPVPGGVGPLTTTMLMRNTIELGKAKYDNDHH